MTIDDALKEINAPEGIKKKDTANTQSAPVSSDVIENYIHVVKTNQPMSHFNVDNIKKFKEHIRFGAGMNHMIKPLEKTDLLNIIESNDPDLKDLLLNTDLGESVRYPFDITSEKYKALPKFLESELKNILHYSDCKDFEFHGNGSFVIPDLNFLSLFMKNGTTFKKYADFKGLIFSSGFYIFDDRNDEGRFKTNTKEIFDIPSLKGFYKQTGIETVTSMIDEYETLLNWMESAELDDTVRNNFKKNLYEDLEKYHPELII